MCKFLRVREVEAPDGRRCDSSGYWTDGRQNGMRPTGQDPARDRIMAEDIDSYRDQYRTGDRIQLHVRASDPRTGRTKSAYYLAQTIITGIYPRFCTTAAAVTVPWIDLMTDAWIDVDREIVGIEKKQKGVAR